MRCYIFEGAMIDNIIGVSQSGALSPGVDGFGLLAVGTISRNAFLTMFLGHLFLEIVDEFGEILVELLFAQDPAWLVARIRSTVGEMFFFDSGIDVLLGMR